MEAAPTTNGTPINNPPVDNLTSKADHLQTVLKDLERSEIMLREREHALTVAKVAYDEGREQVEKTRAEARKALSQIQSDLQPPAPQRIAATNPRQAKDTPPTKPTRSSHAGGKTRRDVIALFLSKERVGMRCKDIAKAIDEDPTKTYNTLAGLLESAYVTREDSLWQITERGIEYVRKLEEADQPNE